jgi:hypothetical protein
VHLYLLAASASSRLTIIAVQAMRLEAAHVLVVARVGDAGNGEEHEGNGEDSGEDERRLDQALARVQLVLLGHRAGREKHLDHRLDEKRRSRARAPLGAQLEDDLKDTERDGESKRGGRDRA